MAVRVAVQTCGLKLPKYTDGERIDGQYIFPVDLISNNGHPFTSSSRPHKNVTSFMNGLLGGSLSELWLEVIPKLLGQAKKKSNVFDNSWEPKMSVTLSVNVKKVIVCHAVICQMLKVGTCQTTFAFMFELKSDCLSCCHMS